jgi:hypothetical protein
LHDLGKVMCCWGEPQLGGATMECCRGHLPSRMCVLGQDSIPRILL